MTQEYLSQESGSHLFKMQTSREVAPVPQFLWVGGQEPNFSGRFVASCKTPSCREDTPPPPPPFGRSYSANMDGYPKDQVVCNGLYVLGYREYGISS